MFFYTGNPCIFVKQTANNMKTYIVTLQISASSFTTVSIEAVSEKAAQIIAREKTGGMVTECVEVELDPFYEDLPADFFAPREHREPTQEELDREEEAYWASCAEENYNDNPPEPYYAEYAEECRRDCDLYEMQVYGYIKYA